LTTVQARRRRAGTLRPRRASWTMIYICTVHFQTERWISRQSAFLRRNLDQPYRVVACVPPTRRRRSFHVESNYEPESQISWNHAQKLNYLARIVEQEAQPDDILIFLDGDAFPVRPLAPYLQDKLSRHPFIAVKRLENDGDIQPHPSFAATTVRFWQEIEGDWSPGFEWINHRGQTVTDAGGNLLQTLNNQATDWHPLLRTNRHNPHPLWFGIYDDVIYHHGAGYRKPISRLDLNRSGSSLEDYGETAEFRAMVRLQNRVFRRMRFDARFYDSFL
jgi:hypothetical protein